MTKRITIDTGIPEDRSRMNHHDRMLKLTGGMIFLVTFTTLVFLSTTTIYWQPGDRPLRRRLRADADLDCRPQCRIPSLVSGRQFYTYFAKKEYECENLRWFGSKDGRKAVCMDLVFNLVPGDCHVLSFGINDEWSFDDSFGRMGCKVYAFDPTMNKEDHQRSENVQFFRMGIGNMKGKRKIGMDEKFDYFEVDTYENILNRLGLINTTIDYLKMDVELSELDFFQDVFRNTPHLLKNVKQIGMELHHGYFGEGLGEKKLGKRNDMGPTSTFQLFWQYFHELRCYGFKLLHARKNNPWTEVVWGQI